MRKFFIDFFPRVFTKVNLSRVIAIFVVGFFIRFSIDFFGGINVFADFLHPVSILFYSFMA